MVGVIGRGGLVAVLLALGCGGAGNAERAAVEALIIEIEAAHAATEATHVGLAALDVAEAEAQVLRVEASSMPAGRFRDEALANVRARVERTHEAGETRVAELAAEHARLVLSLREALAAGTWDVEFPAAAAADLTPEGIAASERTAALLAARERAQ